MRSRARSRCEGSGGTRKCRRGGAACGVTLRCDKWLPAWGRADRDLVILRRLAQGTAVAASWRGRRGKHTLWVVDHAPGLSGLSRRRLALLIVTLGGLSTVGPFAIDLYLPALPSVARDLGATTQSIALTVTTFLIGLAAGQLIAGPLSDAYGRRRPVIVGLAVFTVCSLICALTPSVWVLVVVRLVQGLAGASGVVIANAVVTDYVRGRQAARLLSRLALVSGLAPILAPLAGAQLLRLTSWRGVFVVLAGIGLVLVASVAFGLRESLPPEKRRTGGLGVVTRTMNMLSRDRAFMVYALTSALTFMGFFAYLAGSSFVYQGTYGASPVLFSVLFAANALGMLAANQLNHRLLSRFTPRRLLGAGLIVNATAATGALVVTAIGGLGIAAFAVPVFALVASLGLVAPNSTALALSLHPETAGSASAYFGTLRYGLGALATPLVGIGGAVSGLPMTLVMVVAGVAALVLFAFVARLGVANGCCTTCPRSCAPTCRSAEVSAMLRGSPQTAPTSCRALAPPPRATQHRATTRARVRALPDGGLTVHEDVVHALGVAVRDVLEGRRVRDGLVAQSCTRSRSKTSRSARAPGRRMPRSHKPKRWAGSDVILRTASSRRSTSRSRTKRSRRPGYSPKLQGQYAAARRARQGLHEAVGAEHAVRVPRTALDLVRVDVLEDADDLVARSRRSGRGTCRRRRRRAPWRCRRPSGRAA